MQQSESFDCIQAKSANIAALHPLEGAIRKLESTLSFTKWKHFYFSLEGDKLCFYKNKHEVEHIDVIDLKNVSNISQKSPGKLKGDEKWQIEILMTRGKTYYLCTEREEELHHILKCLQSWLEYFRKEQQSILQNLESNGTPKFLISNSEHKNVINLREYYAIRGEGKSGKFIKDSDGYSIVNLSTRAVYRTEFSKNIQNSAPVDDPNGSISSVRDEDLCLCSLREWALNNCIPSHVGGGLDQFHCKEILRLKRLVSDMKKRESALKNTIDTMTRDFCAKELEYKKQIKEKNMRSEAEKKKFNLIVNSKKFFVEELEREKKSLINSEIEHLKRVIASKDLELKERTLQLASKEVKMLDYKEKYDKLERRYQWAIAAHSLNANRQISGLRKALETMKHQLFNTLTANFKNSRPRNSDYSDMYEQCLNEKIQLELWPTWIQAYMKKNDGSRDEGEEENVDKF